MDAHFDNIDQVSYLSAGPERSVDPPTETWARLTFTTEGLLPDLPPSPHRHAIARSCKWKITRHIVPAHMADGG